MLARYNSTLWMNKCHPVPCAHVRLTFSINIKPQMGHLTYHLVLIKDRLVRDQVWLLASYIHMTYSPADTITS